MGSDRRRVLCLLLCLAAVWLLAACRPAAGPVWNRFGVCAEFVPELQTQLDSMGNIWYYDYNYRSAKVENHPRLFMVRSEPFGDELAAALRAHPGSWWAVGNEPNDPNQDDRTPAEYARLYHDFYAFAKRIDKSCKILPAGIGDADWRWAREFREAHRQLYGRYPRVDGWNIHNYLLDPALDHYDVDEFKRRILAFRRWMRDIGESNKPLFLTEFGILYGAGCCLRPVDPPEKTISFMQETVSWLAETDHVQYWAWFILNNAREFNGGLYDEQGKLSPYGQAYKDLIASLGDTR